MCRLLGYATAGCNLSLGAVLGGRAVDDYRNLSEIHNDGWGTALLSAPVQPADCDDGGAPTPETDTKLYKTTLAARHDPLFDQLAGEPARGALWHLRLASSHLPLIMENQQPFFAHGLSFVHNGDISDDHHRNIVTNREYPVDGAVVSSTGGRSDSAVFFAVILEYVGFGFPLDRCVAQAVRQLRRTYPASSYNCMVQSDDELIVLRASGRERTSPRIVDIYERYGRGAQVGDYRALRYRPVLGHGGSPIGVVAASSGFSQTRDQGWTDLRNDQMLVASNRTGQYRLQSL